MKPNSLAKFIFLVVVSRISDGSYIDQFSWSRPNLPDISPVIKNIIGRAEFSGHVHKQIRGNCDFACQIRKDRQILSVSDVENELSYETLDVPAQVRVRTMMNVSQVPNEILRIERSSSNNTSELEIESRRKRSIFGYDTRHRLSTQKFSTMFPFSTAVQVSTGCAGVLVSPRHVLTSAHCIHNGKNYLKGVKKLRVGRFFDRPMKPKKPKVQKSKKLKKTKNPAETTKKSLLPRSKRSIRRKKQKFRWTRALRTHIPQTWLQPSGNKKPNLMIEYDYAIIELKSNLSKDFMKIGISPSKDHLPNSRRIHFTAFGQTKPKHLLYRFCKVEEQSAEIMYHYCDAQRGTSGAGMYIRLFDRESRRFDRRIIGVFSGHQWVDMGEDQPQKEYNTGVRITPLKFAQICYWTTGDYSQCRNG